MTSVVVSYLIVDILKNNREAVIFSQCDASVPVVSFAMSIKISHLNCFKGQAMEKI